MSQTIKAAIFWVLLLGAALVIGPAAAALVGNLAGPDGGTHVTPLTSLQPLLGVAAGLGALAIAAITGAVGTVILDLKTGLLIAGTVVAWVAYRSGEPDVILRRTHDVALLYRFAAEGALFGGVGVAIFALIADLGKVSDRNQRLFDKEGTSVIVRSTLAAAAAAAAGTWIFSFESLKIHAIFSATVGGIAAGAAAHLVGLSAAPADRGPRRHMVAAMLGMTVVAMAAPLIAALIRSPSATMRAVYDGSLMPLAFPGAFDWIAGALFGIPIGIGWAGSALEQAQHKAAPATAKGI